jgi:membrane fusion protein, multidrug efflux system
MRRRSILFSVTASVMLLGCDEGAVEVAPEPAPVVKLETVSERATGQVRSISGVVEPSDSSTLSFQVGGRVLEVNADVGETVVVGQVLALLDRTNYQIAVDSAQSQLNSARARRGEAKDDLDRKLALIDKGFVTQAAVDGSQASYEAAEASVSVAASDLERAQKDLDRTVLIAPFGGTISSREVDPFVEVSAGTAIFDVQSDGDLEVRVLVPETIIREVDYGQPVSVSFPTLPNGRFGGTVSEIASRAEAGNAFGVKVTLVELNGEDIRAGMTAKVTFNFQSYLNGRDAFLIPLSSIAIKESATGEGARPDAGSKVEVPVFVFDPEQQAVFRREVSIGDIRGNDIEVFEGLSEGDQVVTAGVAFVYDGMPARSWVRGQ